MIEQRLRVGLIGFGYAGKTFHAPLIRATPGLELAAVASSDAGKVRAALGAGPAVLPSAQALIAQAEIDLVVIASPNATHVEFATLALAAGKHVVVDKPFTADTAQAMQLAALASQRGRLLSVFHNRRWDSTTRTASKLLASGMLGEIRYAAMHYDRFRPQPVDRWKERAEAGGGLWMDLGPHLLDEALCYFGPPLAIQADIAAVRPGAGADDSFHARLRYADGLRVDLQASMLGALPRPRLLLQGTRGTYLKQGLDPQEAALKAGLLPRPRTMPLGASMRKTASPCSGRRMKRAGSRCRLKTAPIPRIIGSWRRRSGAGRPTRCRRKRPSRSCACSTPDAPAVSGAARWRSPPTSSRTLEGRVDFRETLT